MVAGDQVRASATYPDDIRCSGADCPNVYTGHPDTARRHGWKIGWTPSMANWCPTCWGGTTRTVTKRGHTAAVTVYDEDVLF